jgi:hypothetical protein
MGGVWHCHRCDGIRTVHLGLGSVLARLVNKYVLLLLPTRYFRLSRLIFAARAG